MRTWAARSQEVFERCNRKTGVNFPDQARGWLTLHRSGLSDEQKAVVIARLGGNLSRESAGAALRSCYPEFVAKKKSMATVDEGFPVEDADDGDDFCFSGAEDVPETDVAEALAASWKENGLN